MKSRIKASVILLLFGVASLKAAVLYVDVNSVHPTSPYGDWTTAATTIQDAVDAASADDLVLVTNGVYQAGGRPAPGEVLTNRVLLTNPVTLQSVNGPAVTMIVGCPVAGGSNSDAAVRCAYLGEGTKLSGFTLANGATRNELSTPVDSQGNGGGAWCQSTNVSISNCVLLSNRCAVYGAGVYSGSLSNCQLAYNGTYSGSLGGGGGLAYSAIVDSTIRSNFSLGGPSCSDGGALHCVLSNCIIEGNLDGGADRCSLQGCSIQNNTNLIYGAGVSHSVLSQCTIWGNRCGNSGGGAMDCVLNNCVVSNNWARYSGGGCYSDGDLTSGFGQSNLVSHNTAQQGGGVYFTAGLVRAPSRDLVNWVVVSNTATGDGGGVYVSGVALIDSCTLSGNTSGGNGGGAYLSGRSTVTNCQVCDNFATGSGGGIGTPTASAPFASAVGCTLEGNVATGNGGGTCNLAVTNCLLVANRAADGGGAYGLMANCVVTDNVASGNGGGLNCNLTGRIVPGCYFTNNSAGNGGGVYAGIYTNCVFSANSATTNGGGVYGAGLHTCLVVSNQALFGGGTFDSGSSPPYPPTGFIYVNSTIRGNSARRDGGGVYGVSSCSVTNCFLESNSATNNGGGAYSGVFGGCTFSGNSAGTNGGGAYNGMLSYCVLSDNFARFDGGGAHNTTLSWCALSNNLAKGNGGGASSGSLSLCVVSSNVAATNGGGSYNASVGNCLLTGNSAATGGGVSGGTLNSSTLVNNHGSLAAGGAYFAVNGNPINSILYDNDAPGSANYSSGTRCDYCCTLPLPATGGHNVTDPPGFVDAAQGNYRLQSNSPCIDASNGGTVGKDLDGRPRYRGSRSDIGAYEYQGAGMGEFISWLQQHGLPTAGSADHTDPDHDGLDNWQEWVAGTEPTNASSVLKMLMPTASADGTTTIVSWQSVSNRTYFLQSSTDLSAAPAFSTLQSNIVGQVGTTSYTDIQPPGRGQVFYRVGIQ